MTIYLMELKKIWKLPLVFLILCSMGFRYWTWTDASGNLTHEYDYAVMMELSEALGTTLEEEEYPQAKALLADLHNELDEIIRNHEDFVTNEVKDFATFKENEQRSSEYPAPENGHALGHYMYDNHFDLLMKEQAYCEIFEQYEMSLENPTYDAYYSWEKELVQNQWNEGLGRSLVPYYVEYRSQNIVYDFFSMSICYMLLLLLPTVTRDKKNNLRDLQWSSSTGRNILWIQYLAHWSTALGLLLPVPFFIFGIISNVEGIMSFWNHSMLGFYHLRHYLVDFTLKELMVCYMIFGTVCSFVLSGFIFLLSRYSPNYPSLLLKAIPFWFLLRNLYESWNGLFSSGSRQFWRLSLPMPPWMDVYLLVGWAIVFGVATFVMFHKEKNRDLLES